MFAKLVFSAVIYARPNKKGESAAFSFFMFFNYMLYLAMTSFCADTILPSALVMEIL